MDERHWLADDPDAHVKTVDLDVLRLSSYWGDLFACQFRTPKVAKYNRNSPPTIIMDPATIFTGSIRLMIG